MRPEAHEPPVKPQSECTCTLALYLVDEVHSGRGYQSHYGLYPHFGLGQRTRVDRVEVRWIGGGTNVLENPALDRLHEITESTRRP